MVKLGILGMGYVGRIHFEAAQKVPEARVLAVATRRPAELPEACRDVQVYARPEELLHDDRLDAVLVCLPTHLHEKAVIAAVGSAIPQLEMGLRFKVETASLPSRSARSETVKGNGLRQPRQRLHSAPSQCSKAA